jgi:YYY domain-containing protein
VFDISTVAIWLFACLGLGVGGSLVTIRGLPWLGRYGPAFGPTVAFVVLGLTGLWVGHLSIRLGLGVGLGILVLGSVAATRRAGWREELRAGIPAYGIFVGAFLFMLWLRALDPAVNPASGEKFLNFGLLKALLRADILPAEDIWFAGKPFSYYYAGQFVVSLLARLTTTPARYAYNLGLATFYATLVTASYGLAGAIGQRWDAGRAAGLLAAFFVGFASNLLTITRLVAWALPDPVASAFGPGAAGDFALPPRSFDYWPASRIVPEMISEFPLFAYLNGDLHAHMLAMPFQVLAIAILYCSFRTPVDRWRYRLVLLFGVLPAVSGFTTATNAWSLPVLAGLTWLTLYYAPTGQQILPRRRLLSSGPFDTASLPISEGHRLVDSTVGTVVFSVGSLVWALPILLVTETPGVSIGVLPSRSPLSSLLFVHGGFLVVLVPYLVSRGRSGMGTREYLAAVGITATVGVVVVLFSGVASLALFTPLAIGAWAVLRQARSTGYDRMGYETLLAFGGLSLIVLVEFVYLEEPAVTGRFNTFFKTYAQIWVLLGVASGVIVGRFVAGRWPSNRSLPRPPTVRYVLVGLLLISTGVYGVGAVHQWTTASGEGIRTPDQPTLDALAFAEERHPGQMDAIEWIDKRSGTPVMASAPGAYIWRGYRWVNAPSSLTGVPTVAGWAHETGYRGSETYWSRVDDVGLVFNGSRGERYRQLERYEVEYVFYGPVERERYGADLFSNEPVVTPVYENDAVTVFRVNQSTLDEQNVTSASVRRRPLLLSYLGTQWNGA